MKKFKKIALVLGITLLLAVIGVVSVSASEYDFQSPSNIKADNIAAACVEVKCFDYEVDGETVNFYYLYDGSSDCMLFRPFDFQRYVNTKLGFNVEHSYDEWFNYTKNPGDTVQEYERLLIDTWNGEFSNCNRAFYNQLYFYDEITQEEVDSIIAEKDIVITEKDSIITEKNTAISNLESQNDKLASDVKGLNSQVSALVEDRTELNAQIKSLESQLQLKINKAYAEGVSDGTDVQVNIIPAVITIIVLALIGLFVALIISKSNRKRTKR